MFECVEHGDVAAAAATKAEAEQQDGGVWWGEEGVGGGASQRSVVVLPAIAALRNTLFYRFSSPEAEHNVYIPTPGRSG